MTKTKKMPKIGPREIEIDGERYEIGNVRDLGNGVSQVDCGRVEFIVATDHETAGEAARAYWESMAQDDPKEFACLVGTETLVQWGMGHHAGPGSTQVASMDEWLDLWLDTPEEHFASYDGNECDVTACGEELAEELGFTPGVAYRHN